MHFPKEIFQNVNLKKSNWIAECPWILSVILHLFYRKRKIKHFLNELFCDHFVSQRVEFSYYFEEKDKNKKHNLSPVSWNSYFFWDQSWFLFWGLVSLKNHHFHFAQKQWCSKLYHYIQIYGCDDNILESVALTYNQHFTRCDINKKYKSKMVNFSLS